MLEYIVIELERSCSPTAICFGEVDDTSQIDDKTGICIVYQSHLGVKIMTPLILTRALYVLCADSPSTLVHLQS